LIEEDWDCCGITNDLRCDIPFQIINVLKKRCNNIVHCPYFGHDLPKVHTVAFNNIFMPVQNALNIAPRGVHFETEKMAKAISPQPTINPISSVDRTNYEGVLEITNQLTNKPTFHIDSRSKERTNN
jgi:hypothetical protein